jgi:hypothetical protein
MGMAAWAGDTTTATTDPWSRTVATNGTVYTLYVNNIVSTSSIEFVEEIKKPRYRPPPPVERKLSPPKQLKARHGFQQMCRIPCYRGVRTR